MFFKPKYLNVFISSFSLREKMDKKDSEYWDKCEVKFHSLEMLERKCDEKIRDEKLERLNKN